MRGHVLLPALLSILCSPVIGCSTGELRPPDPDLRAASEGVPLEPSGDGLIPEPGQIDGAARPDEKALPTYALPADRTVTWRGNVGVPGDIPQRTVVCGQPLGPTGGDDAPAIQAAIKSCPSGQVVRLTAGTFRVGSPIAVKSGITLRGAGMGATVIQGIKGMSGTYLLGVGSAGFSWGSSVALKGGLGKGSLKIQTATAHGWSQGDLVLVDQLNQPGGDPPVNNTGNNGTCTWCGRQSGQRSLGQLVKIVAVPSPTEAQLEVPLYWSYQPALSPQATRVQNVTRDAGAEDLTVDNSLSASAAQVDNGGTVVMGATSGCWLLRVEVAGSYQNLIQLMQAYRDTIRSCKLHDGVPAGPCDGPQYGPARSYGLRLSLAASANLIEHTRLYHLSPAVILNGAASGNVFGYNTISELCLSQGSWQPHAILNHGAHPMMNLWEGNFVVDGRLAADNVWGSSSHTTFFRNRVATASSVIKWTGALWDFDLHLSAWYVSVVGNVVGRAGFEGTYELHDIPLSGQRSIYRLGYTSDGDGNAAGNDPKVKATLLRHGNWDSVTNGVIWNGTDERALPASLYLGARPSWLPATVPWPPIGPDVSPMFPAIPAGAATPW